MKDHSSYKRHARTFAAALAILTLMTTALLWGWNTFATEVLALPSIKFKHALALELFLVVVASTIPIAWRLFAVRHHRNADMHP